jgi:hypothetical protein
MKLPIQLSQLNLNISTSQKIHRVEKMLVILEVGHYAKLKSIFILYPSSGFLFKLPGCPRLFVNMIGLISY